MIQKELIVYIHRTFFLQEKIEFWSRIKSVNGEM